MEKKKNLTATFGGIVLYGVQSPPTLARTMDVSERPIPGNFTTPSVEATTAGPEHITISGNVFEDDLTGTDTFRTVEEVYYALQDGAPHSLVLDDGTTVTAFLANVKCMPNLASEVMRYEMEFIVTSLSAGWGDLLPLTSCAKDLGSTSYLWRYLYSQFGYFRNAGTATDVQDQIQLINSGNASSMTDTRTRILFSQYYYDAVTPAVADAGGIVVGTEGNWTSTGSSQDSYMAFLTGLNGTIAEKMRITSAGTLCIGATSRLDSSSELVVSSDTLGCSEWGSHNATAASGVFKLFYRSRGTRAEPSIISSGDNLVSFIARGYGTAAYYDAAAIYMNSDGTPGSSDMPGNITFLTTPDGSATLVERMRITNAGKVGIGTATPSFLATVSANTANLPTTVPSGGNPLLHLGQVDASIARLLIDAFGNYTQLQFRRANNTNASPSALASGDVIGGFGFWGYGATGYITTARAAMYGYAAENWSDTAAGTYISFFTTALTGTTLGERMRVKPAGVTIYSLPVYANNAAAAAGGLVAGDLYRTNGDPDAVCVTH
jgi:hypothetical protein